MDFFLDLPLSDDFVILPYKNMSMIYGTSPLQWGDKFRRVRVGEVSGEHLGTAVIPLLDCLPPSSRKHKVSLQGEMLGFFFCKEARRYEVTCFFVSCFFWFLGWEEGNNKGDTKRHFFQLLSFQKKSRVPNF